MFKQTVLKYWERHSSSTHEFDESPVKDLRLDFLSGGKTVGCLAGTLLNLPAVMSQGGFEKLKAILVQDRLLRDLKLGELLTGVDPQSNEFDGQWLPSIVSQAHKHGIVPHRSGILFIRMIEADRYLRGSGIGHHLIQWISKELRDAYPLVMLEACPVDYKLDMSDRELMIGQRRLEAHYQAVGFQQTEAGAMVASSHALAGLSLTPLFEESGKPSLRIVV